MKFRKHKKELIKTYREAKEISRGYPFIRYQIADIKCLLALKKDDVYDLAKWQKRRDVYWHRLIRERPRNNEFFSY